MKIKLFVLISCCAACIFMLLSFIDGSVNIEKQEQILWYKQPAKKWTEALPLGNGRIGAMVFGDPIHERIQLNDDSLWPAETGWKEPEGTREDVYRVRNLLIEGKNREADDLLVDKFSNKSVLRSHQTLGDLFIDYEQGEITEYRRSLNLSKALTTVSFKSDGVPFKQQMLVSHPDRAMVIHLKSEGKKGINATFKLSRPEDQGFPTTKSFTTEAGILVMNGEVTQRGAQFRSEPNPILNGVKFETRLQVVNKDGDIKIEKDRLQLINASEATIYIVSNSSYYAPNFSQVNKFDLTSVSRKPFESILQNHLSDYQALYARVDLNLGENQFDKVPTDKRLKNVKKGKNDPGLTELLFQYGRYLLISSSRRGSNPANLQGLWNDQIEAPWNADYHLNINLQMNYWLANVTNLEELNEPLFDYVDKLVENGKITAQTNFGCKGSFFPHATDLWAPTWMRAATAYWGASMGAGGWMMQHYWQHYEFTRDLDFLKNRAYPAIREVAQFYSDWLIEDPRDGTLISAPSTSPENRFINQKGEKVASCLGSAMDQQVIAEVFDNYLKACQILQINSPLKEKIIRQKAGLRPGFIIGEDGRILEWDREYEEFEPGHRHMSHLYGFHPGVSVSIGENPEIFEAVRKTLEFRLANGGAGTGWSRAWLINCSARLLDGEMAREHIQLMFEKSILSNLFDSHPPFQIDGNFGFTAGIAEMLLQSHEKNTLRILPALPKAWASGHIKGIKARGNLSLDIIWDQGQLERVVLYSKTDQNTDLLYDGHRYPISIKKGQAYIFELKS